MLCSIWVKLQLRDCQHSIVELVARLVRVPGFAIAAASRALMGENGPAWVKAERKRMKRLVMKYMFVRECFGAVFFPLFGMLCRSRVIEKRDPEFIDLFIVFILSKRYNHIVHHLVLYKQFFCLIDD